ncbi:aldehyde dehydrogenase family protein [Phaeovulum vinaykumarii]|uniref:Acyl-CoA reductase n=1 Tax=Phaeovulum vinaykumarii TaxID=407234 RepID=A0A1N7K1V1_9RHOB|nr:hypothetical protein [Phaeovulum vinaykumarii]SIS55518.1 Acyl-CoA reductase [Phaeovulum vinaykumarii]SOB92412.1 acyl-CoA reductase-like NAD-dependent aldehyde dehydrogenase [Phaeovulum vinaykumarii]
MSLPPPDYLPALLPEAPARALLDRAPPAGVAPAVLGQTDCTGRGAQLAALAARLRAEAETCAAALALAAGRPAGAVLAHDLPRAAAALAEAAGACADGGFAAGVAPAQGVGLIVAGGAGFADLAEAVARALLAHRGVMIADGGATASVLVAQAQMAGLAGLALAPSSDTPTSGTSAPEATAPENLTAMWLLGADPRAALRDTRGACPVWLAGRGTPVMIVAPDADPDAAADAVAEAAWSGAAGDGLRVLVAEALLSTLERRLRARLARLRAGNPRDLNVDLGPGTPAPLLEALRGESGLGIAEGPGGAALILGASLGVPGLERALSGPLVTVESFRTLPEALTLANATPWPHAAAVFATAWADIETLVRGLAAPVVRVNRVLPQPGEAMGGLVATGPLAPMPALPEAAAPRMGDPALAAAIARARAARLPQGRALGRALAALGAQFAPGVTVGASEGRVDAGSGAFCLDLPAPVGVLGLALPRNGTDGAALVLTALAAGNRVVAAGPLPEGFAVAVTARLGPGALTHLPAEQAPGLGAQDGLDALWVCAAPEGTAALWAGALAATPGPLPVLRIGAADWRATPEALAALAAHARRRRLIHLG